MLFNVHNGQVRFSSVQTGSQPIFRPKSPKGILMMRSIEGGHKGFYRADAIGNIDVRAPKHIDVMVGLGYPIYDGNGKMHPVPKEDLLYPNLNLDSSYWRNINKAKNLAKEE